MPKHCARIAYRSDFDKPWSLWQFKNPKTKFIVVKCVVCNPPRRVQPKKVGQIHNWEDLNV